MNKIGGLNMFDEARESTSLCPVAGIAAGAAAKDRNYTEKDVDASEIDPSTWEELLAVVDSGATVPVLIGRFSMEFYRFV